MADTSVRQVLVCHGMGLLVLVLMSLTSSADAFQYKVGGSGQWTVPAVPGAYNQWAGKMRFKIGDSILFVYPSDKDSVLQVTVDDYNTCNTKSPLAKFEDGNTVFMFNQSEFYFFISGVEENCLKNESMVIKVLADRTNKGGSSPSPAPATAPVASSPPSSPPSESSPPPPPPPSESSPPPPPPSPSSSGSTAPAPLPSGGESSLSPPPPPPPNAASAKVVGFVSSIAALLGSSLLVFM